MVRGEIYMVRLEPRSGSEQTGVRPGIIVSNDAFNTAPGWQSITIVPLTSAPRWVKVSPTTVVFKAGTYGLTRDCAALAHQVTTIDRSKLLLPMLGSLPAAALEAVGVALRNYLALS
ncbi:MAG: type II toxin-antitoxin system PemK/MazF family toxin [Candidatus Xenobia bacterium]